MKVTSLIDVLLVHISTSYINWSSRADNPQLGQYYIAEYAYRNGYNVRIKNYCSDEPLISSISNLLNELKCKVIGFYIDSENIWTIRNIVFDIKSNVPGLVVFLGGPQLTGAPENTLRRVEDADFGVIGEGEITITDLLKSNFNYKDELNHIPGLCYIDSKNNYVCTGYRTMTSDLDVYPYPIRERYTLDTDIQFTSILTGRGCVGKCAFCFEGSKVNNILRLRSVKSVCEEIEYLVGNLPENAYLSFLDDTFIINPQRTEEICNWLINKYNGRVKWYCEARVDILIRNLHLLPLMKKAGLIRIQLGGESGNQQILDAYNKGIKISNLVEVVKAIYNSGINSVYINFIIGGAFETIDSFKQTLDLAKELLEIAPGCAEIGSSLLVPYVGSPIYEHPEKYGLRILDKDIITGPDSVSVFVETDKLSAAKISQLKDIFEKSISESIQKIITKLSYTSICRHYEILEKYNVKSFYIDELEKITSVHNYFDAIRKENYCSINDISIKDISCAIPFRTDNVISDGEDFFRVLYNGKYVHDSGLYKDIITLSSGKISFDDIIIILSNKYHDYKDIEKEVFSVYQNLDAQFWIVWKTKF